MTRLKNIRRRRQDMPWRQVGIVLRALLRPEARFKAENKKNGAILGFGGYCTQCPPPSCACKNMLEVCQVIHVGVLMGHHALAAFAFEWNRPMRYSSLSLFHTALSVTDGQTDVIVMTIPALPGC